MSAYLSLIGGSGGGCLFEAGRLLTFSAFRIGANSRLGAYSNKYGILFCCYLLKIMKLKSAPFQGPKIY